MIDKTNRVDAFICNSTAQHQQGLRAYGKLYKKYSHQALVSVFDQLCDRLSVSTAIEVGAFQAEFSRRFLNRGGPERVALAIEANPYNFDAFKDGLADAGVLYHHAAVQDQIGPCTLQLSVTEQDIKNGHIRGNNSLLPTHQRPETTPLTVPGTTLDALVTSYVDSGKLPAMTESPPALWIDVEGALDLVIAGGAQTISHSLAIFAEVETRALWDEQTILPEICLQLGELGFVPFARDCEYEPDQFNVLFVHRQLEGKPLLKELAITYAAALNQPPTQTFPASG